MLPAISVICVTGGRVKHLEEALACFLNQNYAGRKELVIFNTFPLQKLRFEHPEVTIVNLPFRPSSLGACRNYAVNRAGGRAIVVLDDDDLMLPHHLTVVGEGFKESEADWLKINPVFYAEGYLIRREFDTWVNAIAYTKNAFHQAGGYPANLSVGEDRAFFQGLSEKCRGATVQLKTREISLIYNWGNNVYHISGHGPDKPGEVDAWQRSRLDLERRVQSGEIPLGEIALRPNLVHDPAAMAALFLTPPVISKKKRVAVVELGRYGDIVNMLPIAKHIHDTYDTPYFIVAREFADVLEGVSYVRPEPVPYEYSQLKQALAYAETKFDCVINCQIWGHDWKHEKITEAYNRDSWLSAGFSRQFDNPRWLPWFDRRDRTREATLCRKLYLTSKPKILVQVTKGLSSPFPAGPKVFAAIQSEFAERCEVVNIADLRITPIVDLLGFIELADVLVSIDTSLIHFAAATATPVVALVNPQPWSGSALRCRTAGRVTYTQAEQDPKTVIEAIWLGLKTPKAALPAQTLKTPPTRRLFHLVERHQEDTKVQARKQAAFDSWDVLYAAKQVIPCQYTEYKRNSMTIGDYRSLPYLKDVLAKGLVKSTPEDVLMFTNDDIILHPEIVDLLLLHCSLYECVAVPRVDFKHCPRPGTTPNEWMRQGASHNGRDLFAFTHRWLAEHFDQIPDFILGARDWDLCLATMIRQHFGIASKLHELQKPVWPAESLVGYVGHMAHEPVWSKGENYTKSPANLHNGDLFRKWAARYSPVMYNSL